MKKLIYLNFAFILFAFSGFSQTEDFNLASENLHKKVKKTITHYYSYDKNSGGFVKKSVSIKNYNDDGNLAETFYLYHSIYSESNPQKTVYHYNSKNLLVNTEDISDKRGKYTSEKKYTYNKKGHLLKRKSVYKDGSFAYINYTNNRKGKVTRIEEYSSNGKLSHETDITYKGAKRTEIQTSYSSKDGSIFGSYTTVFKDNVKYTYKSEGKYSNSTTSYEYDKQGNLKKTVSKGKKNTTTNYDYVYDKKDNWVKKHYRSGKYHYFYFREIFFKNGKISGNTDFDRNFINKHGNFDNVAVVPLKKKEKKKNTNTNNTTVVHNTNSNMPTFRYKNWSYKFVNMKDKINNITGKIDLSVENTSNMSDNATVKISIIIDGSSTRSGLYTVKSYSDTGKEHKWIVESQKNGKKSTLYIFKEKKYIRKVYLDGLFIIGKGDDQITFYLQ